MTENTLPQVVYLPVDWIHVRHNVRRTPDPERDAELVESIRHDGIIQPLVVRVAEVSGRPGQTGLGVPGYWVVFGHRRLAAAREAGLTTVPAIVRELTDQEARELQLVENLQRQDLNAIDEARAFRELLDMHDYKQETLARRLGISEAQVSNRLRLLRLPAEVQQNIARGALSAGHGLALLRLEENPEMLTRAACHLAEKRVPVASAAEIIDCLVLDWMEEVFDGDLVDAATVASHRAAAEELVSGPLWDAIGPQVLQDRYRLRRLQPQRHKATRLRQREQTEEQSEDAENLLNVRYKVGDYWQQFGDLTRSGLEGLAAHYDGLSRGNGFERDYCLKIVRRLKGEGQVRQVFDSEMLLELRRELAVEQSMKLQAFSDDPGPDDEAA